MAATSDTEPLSATSSSASDTEQDATVNTHETDASAREPIKSNSHNINDTKEQEDEEDMVKVYLRLRPHEERESPEGPAQLVYSRADDDTLQVLDDMTVDTMAPEESQSFKNRETGGKYKFTRIFNKPTTQEELFEATTLPLIDTLLEDGKDGLLFAYGVTNAGKTYTVEGSESNPGIIPRTMQIIFDKLEAKRATLGSDPENYEARVEVSYLQIYNEQVHDLQAASKASYLGKERLKIKLRDEGVEVVGLKSTPIVCSKEGIEIVARGREARETHETECNLQSSRSHSVFVITVEQKGNAVKNLPANAAAAKPARLYIVDLAGSERGKRTNASRARQREASNINCSLMNLMRCLDTLRLNQKNKKLNKREKMVPFRESKLTLLFRDCFIGSNCGGVSMIVNASARPEDYDETAHALKYGALVKNVKVARQKVSRRKSGARYGSNGRKLTPAANASATPSGTSSYHGTRTPASALRSGYRAKPDTLIPEDYYDTDEEGFANMSIEDHPVVHALIHELADARLRCINMEAEIRQEVAQEMAQRLEEMEAVFRRRVDAAKQISDNKSDMLLKNLRKRMEEGGKNHLYSMEDIEALVTNINECEEEMERMRQLHSADTQILNREIDQLKDLLKSRGNGADEPESDPSSAAAVASAAAGARRKSVESRRKSFERLDRIVVDQLDSITRYKEELAEERALHEKTIKQLESATQLAKDAQVGEADAERQLVALRIEADQLREKLRVASLKSRTEASDSASNHHHQRHGSGMLKHITTSQMLPSQLRTSRSIRRPKALSVDDGNEVSTPSSKASTNSEKPALRSYLPSSMRTYDTPPDFDGGWSTSPAVRAASQQTHRNSTAATAVAAARSASNEPELPARSARVLSSAKDSAQRSGSSTAAKGGSSNVPPVPPLHNQENCTARYNATSGRDSPMGSGKSTGSATSGTGGKSFAALIAASKHRVEGAASASVDGSRGLVNRMVGRMRR
ncbi:Kinesin, putative [Hondaea fermentalgiana]|uniref:Kinesin-like protein n=1 Tax=Hondaea fermentalgiana TaxID=2315210 RepID=A0A2R5G6V6_9STRA|nr:Kinesin, putative [Hondaea fermentalgiana]|eukprot:GBG26049.1 Kinesin, putative [Hondaea fermentalgiana]